MEKIFAQEFWRFGFHKSGAFLPCFPDRLSIVLIKLLGNWNENGIKPKYELCHMENKNKLVQLKPQRHK